MKRSAIGPKTYEAALERRVASQTRQREKAALSPRRTRKPARDLKAKQRGPRKARLGPGKKTKAWDKARATIKKRFEKAGITTCELRGVVPHECKVDNWLSFAHDGKRRKLRPEDLYRVILCCTIGHDVIEKWSAEKMKVIVNETIEKRSVQP